MEIKVEATAKPGFEMNSEHLREKTIYLYVWEAFAKNFKVVEAMKLMTTNVLSPAKTFKIQCQMSHRGNTRLDKPPTNTRATDTLGIDLVKKVQPRILPTLSLSLYKNDQGNNYVKPRN